MFKRGTEAARQARGKDCDLEQRVRRDLTFLFDQYGATVSSDTLQARGNSEVSVAVGNLEFQFAKNEHDGENRAVVGGMGMGFGNSYPWLLPQVRVRMRLRSLAHLHTAIILRGCLTSASPN